MNNSMFLKIEWHVLTTCWGPAILVLTQFDSATVLNIEDISCPRVDTNFIFEDSTRRYRVEYEQIKFVSTSAHVIFFLLYKHTNDDVFDDFPKFSEHFPKISEDFSFESQTKVSEHFLKITEDHRTATNLRDDVTIAMGIFSLVNLTYFDV